MRPERLVQARKDGVQLAGHQATLMVAEVFGPTFQGEGPSLGRRADFIRLMGCNLTCRWCDTPYTWDSSRFDLRAEGRRMTPNALIRRVMRDTPEVVVITGGEPMLHQKQEAWPLLLRGLFKFGLKVEIETNGTVAPLPDELGYVSRFNVSPKLSHSGDLVSKRIDYNALAVLASTGLACFKFVVRNEADLDEVQQITDRARIADDMIWIMPEGTNAEVLNERLVALAPAVIARRWNMTTRLHVLAFGDKRGV